MNRQVSEFYLVEHPRHAVQHYARKPHRVELGHSISDRFGGRFPQERGEDRELRTRRIL
jgi:hypothetical protein